jgi:ParB-like chromosome segregation protein Spo0J
MKNKEAPPTAALTIEIWLIGRPIPYEHNARKCPAIAIKKVADSLKEYGWQQPIVVDAEGVIIVGHTRLLAAKKLGMTEVPVVVATNLTAAQCKAYRIMDNRSAQETSWDFDVLASELAGLKDLDIDLTLTGFEAPELLKLMHPEEDEAPPDSTYKEQYGVIVMCEDEASQKDIFDRLTDEGLSCKIVVT